MEFTDAEINAVKAVQTAEFKLMTPEVKFSDLPVQTPNARTVVRVFEMNAQYYHNEAFKYLIAEVAPRMKAIDTIGEKYLDELALATNVRHWIARMAADDQELVATVRTILAEADDVQYDVETTKSWIIGAIYNGVGGFFY